MAGSAPRQTDAPRSSKGSPAGGVPTLPDRWVERPTLEARLDEAFAHPLTVVTATAGAGKSTSAAAWCRHHAYAPVTWLRADGSLPTDRDLARQLLRLGGVEEVALPLGLNSHAMRRRVASLLEERTASGILVIDDAHQLHPQATRLIGELLDSCPRAIRVVLLCRWDPLLSWLTAELRGDLCRLRGDVFRMTAAESRELVEAHALGLPAEAVDTILEATQGWPALIALAARTVAFSQDPVTEAARLAEPGLAIADLLANEVFAAMSDATRRLLLCVSGEEEVDARTAVRLTGDPGAGALIAKLASSGLLVTKVRGEDDVSTYRLHPLLREVTRRHLCSGGVVAVQANAFVRRAGLADIAMGRTADGVRRLVHALAWPDAVRALGDSGEQTLLQMPGSVLTTLTEEAPDLVAASPRASLMVALDRWARLDVNGAMPILNRVVAADTGLPPLELALARMLRARLGAEPWGVVAAQVRDLVSSSSSPDQGAPALICWLLSELAQAESWAGELDHAERHLRLATLIAEPLSHRLRLTTLSQLAQVEYLRGNMRNAISLADEVLEDLFEPADAMAATLHRARVIRAIADPLSYLASTDDEPPMGARFLSDPVTRALSHKMAGRRRVVAGTFHEAAAQLDLPSLPLSPSPHISARLALDRAFVAKRLEDKPALGALVSSLRECGAFGESDMVEATLAELEGRLPVAAGVLRRVAAGEVTSLLALTPMFAAVVRAQLLSAMGQPAEATALLASVVKGTASQRIMVPFVLPTVQGVPVHTMLEAIQGVPEEWLQEIRAVTELLPADAFLPDPPRRGHLRRTGSAPPERPTDLLEVHLTAREEDVLAELARGSTYSDIAGSLYVTENTVKTHVSSLYAKLGAARRSDALKAARSRGLL